jgi:hypothetical protein
MRALLLAISLLMTASHVFAAPLGPNVEALGVGTRIYVLRGLGDETFSQGVDEIGALLKQHSPRAVVQVGNWYEWQAFAADAVNHPSDRLVFIGFSMGSMAAAGGANHLAARGLAVKVIGIDPMCAAPSVERSPLIEAVNFYATPCVSGRDGTMVNARNVKVQVGDGTLAGHISFPSNPVVQALVIREALTGEMRPSPPSVTHQSPGRQSASRRSAL